MKRIITTINQKWLKEGKIRMSPLIEEMQKAVKEIQESPAYLVGYYASGEYCPFNIYQDNETARTCCDLLATAITHSNGNLIEWTIRRTTVGAGIDLLNKEEDEEMNSNKQEIKYRLKHKSTGQYVSYLGVAEYREDSMIPEKIDAIEFTDLESEAEEFFFEWLDNDLDIVPQLSLSRLELYYTQFFLGIEKIEEDEEEYVFYSQEAGMYLFEFDNYTDKHSGICQLTLTASPIVAKVIKKNSEDYHAIRSNTSLRKIEVSDLD